MVYLIIILFTTMSLLFVGIRLFWNLAVDCLDVIYIIAASRFVYNNKRDVIRMASFTLAQPNVNKDQYISYNINIVLDQVN